MEGAQKLIVPLCGAMVGALLLGLLVLLGTQQEDDSLDGCTPGGNSLTVADGPSHRVGQWSAEQVRNAAAVVNAGTKLGVPARGQKIAVMTAIGESSLVVVDHGDTAGPDSRGLFQQRATGWGSYAQRMDPAGSATSFYKRLLETKGWDSMSPTQAAHAVQRNADPNHYTKFYASAVALVDQLTSGAGADVTKDVAKKTTTSTSEESVDQMSTTSTSSTGSGGTAGITSLSTDTGECGAAGGSSFGLNPGGYVGPYNPAQLTQRAQAFVKAGNRDPFFGSVSGGWYRICQHFVANMSGRSSSGYGTAMDAWGRFVAKGTAHRADAVDGNAPPPGAWLYYNGGGAAGHVAIYLGNGQIASNDVFGSGKIGIGPASAITDDKWHLNYLGWAAPWGTKVPTLRPTQPGTASKVSTTTNGGTSTSGGSSSGAGAADVGSVPAGNSSGGGGSFRLASFNVLGAFHTAGGDQHPTWASGAQRIVGALKILNNSGASVAGLQEFEHSQATTFNQAAGGSWVGWYPGTDTRNAIVWRTDTWQLAQTAQLPIPYVGGMLPMPAVQLKLKSTGATVWFVNVHNPSNLYGKFGNARAASLRRERAAMARLASTGSPVFITGDFNDKAAAVCAFRGLLTSAFTPGRNTCSLGPGEKVDHILGRGGSFSGTSSNRTPKNARISDHPIAYTTVTLN